MGRYTVDDYIKAKNSENQSAHAGSGDNGDSSVTPGQTPFFVNGDYDKLENAPVKNLNGKSTSNFIVLSGIDPGEYVLQGYYKKDSFSDIEYAEEPFRLSIVHDIKTGKKMLYYFDIEDGEAFIRKIEYDLTGIVTKEDRRYIEGIKWEDF